MADEAAQRARAARQSIDGRDAAARKREATYMDAVRRCVAEFVQEATRLGIAPDGRETVDRRYFKPKRRYWAIQIPTSAYCADGGWRTTTIGVPPNGEVFKLQSRSVAGLNRTYTLLVPWSVNFDHISQEDIVPESVIRDYVVSRRM